MIPALVPQPSTAPQRPPDQDRLFRLAQDLEANFLAQMLGHAGVGDTPEAFGGGAGEDQFGSFLRQEQANAMVKAGGIGLAETLFRAMMKEHDNV